MGATVPVQVTVNGEAHASEVPARMLLVHYLRDELGLTGTHVGCDTSNCGACTCLSTASRPRAARCSPSSATARRSRRSRGWPAPTARCTPLQEGFWAEHGLQCGYCTPGMIMAAADLLARHSGDGPITEDEVRHGLEGNLCRCTGYHNIVKAVQAAAEASRRIKV